MSLPPALFVLIGLLAASQASVSPKLVNEFRGATKSVRKLSAQACDEITPDHCTSEECVATRMPTRFPCAAEGGECHCPGGTIEFGAGAHWLSQTWKEHNDDRVPCSKQHWGDPAPGLTKACFCLQHADLSAFENQNFQCSGTIKFGSANRWQYADTGTDSPGPHACSVSLGRRAGAFSNKESPITVPWSELGKHIDGYKQSHGIHLMQARRCYCINSKFPAEKRSCKVDTDCASWEETCSSAGKCEQPEKCASCRTFKIYQRGLKTPGKTGFVAPGYFTAGAYPNQPEKYGVYGEGKALKFPDDERFPKIGKIGLPGVFLPECDYKSCLDTSNGALLDFQ